LGKLEISLQLASYPVIFAYVLAHGGLIFINSKLNILASAEIYTP
jgi:hypothetical protein